MNIELVPPSSEANNQSIPRNPSESAVMSYLTQQNRADIRAALEAQRGKLIKAMQAALEESGQTQFSEVLGRASGDSADEALAVTLGDLSAARLDHEVRACKRWKTRVCGLTMKDFGLCVDCEAEIPVARLIANPVRPVALPAKAISSTPTLASNTALSETVADCLRAAQPPVFLFWAQARQLISSACLTSP
jgi:DnaK suppressor protein